MNIKSLLLGSAAAMVAVSSAQAADAVVVEPEPVEFVRVCDAYGSGFFFIPGTETCIRFGGFIRSSYEKASASNITVNGVPNAAPANDQNATLWSQRTRFNIDTRNETDWGTLRGLFRIEAGDANDDVDFDMDVALISLAGFRAGFTGGNYWSSAFQSPNFSAVAGIGGGGLEDTGWSGFDDATIFDYTFASGGFTATIGIEDLRIAVSSENAGAPNFSLNGGGTAVVSNSFNRTNNAGAESRVNYYGGITYSDELIDLRFVAAHDSLALDNSGDQGGWAYRASIGLDISEFIAGGLLTANYSYDGEYHTDYVHNYGILSDPESIWSVGFQADVTDELQFLAQYSQAEGDDAGADSAAVNASGDPLPGLLAEGDAWLASVGLNWFPAAAPQFSVRASYIFGEVENTNSAVFGGRGATGNLTSYDFDQFTIGVRRDF